MPVICPFCGLSNEADKQVCARCGKPLVVPDSPGNEITALPAATLPQVGPPVSVPAGEQAYTSHIGKLGTNSVALYIGNQAEPMIIDISQQITLGRLVPNSGIQPTVDLTPFGAYEKGVSRVHVTIRRQGDGLSIEDMGSSNGTWLEGLRLQHYQAVPVAPGNHLWLGRLEIVLYFQAEAKLPIPGMAAAPQTAAVSHYHASFPLNPAQLDTDLKPIVEQIIKRLIALKGADVRVALNVDGYATEPFNEEIQQAIDANIKQLAMQKVQPKT